MSGAIYPDLAGKTVLVTGAASGIGEAMTRHFSAQGSRVALLDLPGPALDALASELGAGAAPVLPLAVDLRDIAAARAAIASAERELGPVRVLVNNAGNDDRRPWEQVEPAYWDDRFAVNVRHQFFAAQAVAPGMAAAGGGSIVNLGSISWMFGAAGLIAYTTAKAAIMGMTKSLARELGPMRIRVNSIAPGMIWTSKQIERARAESPGKFQAYLDRQCIKELLEPADIARLALWLASEESRRASGQTYILDGGVV
jgi:NAD(P)-dependent dehydrogenase (short-subunit alcohol dehydrogenase family)